MEVKDVSTNNLAIGDLPDSLRVIAEGIKKMISFSPEVVRDLVMDAGVTESDLLPYSDFEHSVTDSYGRKLVFDGGFFEIMVMSWCPGDLSSIHDHGYTQWGAVQIFGALEHTSFILLDKKIEILSKEMVKEGETNKVSHDLIHQMGNFSKGNILSLHIYGNYSMNEHITSDSRNFNLRSTSIEKVDGGAFFALPRKYIKEKKPLKGSDLVSWLRNQLGLISRVERAIEGNVFHNEIKLEDLKKEISDKKIYNWLLTETNKLTDDKGHYVDSKYWGYLKDELIKLASSQLKDMEELRLQDSFDRYAQLYDKVIGKPCLDGFMKQYLKYFFENYISNMESCEVLSIGCGTGLIEEYIINELRIKKDNLLGFDLSAAMVEVASKKINAFQGNVLEMDKLNKKWNVAFSGLNVLQYLSHEHFEESIRNIASKMELDGYFVGDFITPDHIRWYPNRIVSDDLQVISLRTPELIEKEGFTYQRSEILNIQLDEEKMIVYYSGKHDRYLPSLKTVRETFKKYFMGKIDIFDPVSGMIRVDDQQETTHSTRYVVIARF